MNFRPFVDRATPPLPQTAPGHVGAARIPDQTEVGAMERPRVKGKFLFVGAKKFWVRGVTYGLSHPLIFSYNISIA